MEFDLDYQLVNHLYCVTWDAAVKWIDLERCLQQYLPEYPQ